MNAAETSAAIVFELGPMAVSNTVLTTWGVMALFAGLGLWRVIRPASRLQNALEAVVVSIETAIAEVLPSENVRPVLPFIATLWVFVLVANLVGLIPELHSPTRDLSATSALAVLVFAATHWFGIHRHGLRQHLRHYIEPSPILLPFHIISEITRLCWRPRRAASSHRPCSRWSC